MGAPPPLWPPLGVSATRSASSSVTRRYVVGTVAAVSVAGLAAWEGELASRDSSDMGDSHGVCCGLGDCSPPRSPSSPPASASSSACAVSAYEKCSAAMAGSHTQPSDTGGRRLPLCARWGGTVLENVDWLVEVRREKEVEAEVVVVEGAVVGGQGTTDCRL